MQARGKVAVISGAGGGGQGRAVAPWWTGQKRGLIPVGDLGYARLE